MQVRNRIWTGIAVLAAYLGMPFSSTDAQDPCYHFIGTTSCSAEFGAFWWNNAGCGPVNMCGMTDEFVRNTNSQGDQTEASITETGYLSTGLIDVYCALEYSCHVVQHPTEGNQCVRNALVAVQGFSYRNLDTDQPCNVN